MDFIEIEFSKQDLNNEIIDNCFNFDESYSSYIYRFIHHFFNKTQLILHLTADELKRMRYIACKFENKRIKIKGNYSITHDGVHIKSGDRINCIYKNADIEMSITEKNANQLTEICLHNSDKILRIRDVGKNPKYLKIFNEESVDKQLKSKLTIYIHCKILLEMHVENNILNFNYDNGILIKLFVQKEQLNKIKNFYERKEQFFIVFNGCYFVDENSSIHMENPSFDFAREMPTVEILEQMLVLPFSSVFDQKNLSRLTFSTMYPQRIFEQNDDRVCKTHYHLTEEQWETLKNIIYNSDEWSFALDGVFSVKREHWEIFNGNIPYTTEKLVENYGSMNAYCHYLSSFKSLYVADIYCVDIEEKHKK